MKKNKFGIVFIFLLIFIFPLVINASNYETESNNANRYILRNTYINTYSRYLLDGNESFRIPFAFNNGSLSTRDEFVYGGLLNKDEYILSKNSKGNSYLYDGSSYWTMTENGSNVFTISYSGEKEVSSTSEEYLARATEFVRPETAVSGSGTINDPWVFEPMYNITFVTDESKATFISLNNRNLNDSEKANVSTYILGKCSTTGCIADIVVEPKSGYQYIANDCNGRYDTESHHLIVSNLNRDLTCTIRFGVGFFNITFDQESIDDGVKPTEFYLQMNESFYKNKMATDVIRKLDDIPSRTGYTLEGFYYNGIKVIDNNGNIIDSAKYNIKEDAILTRNQVAATYTLKYNLDGGNMVSGSLPESIEYDKPLNINNPAKAGYEFTGWTFTGIDTNTAMSGSSSTNITNRITNPNALNKSTHFKNLSSTNGAEVGMKANWSQCVAGTYSDSTKSSCVACPSGYTSAAGANSINKCYINVAAGYYLKTANTTTKEVCPNGQYSTGGNVFYGSTSSCTQCPTGYRDGTALANKTSESVCLRNVPAGNYVASSKATSNTACATGYYKGAHTVTYGTTSSCTQCPAGYRDGNTAEYKTSQSACARSVPAGYYIASANATSSTVCANGYYKTSHFVKYGTTSSCTQCPAGYRDGTAVANKTAESTCLRNVAAGNYVASAKATSNTACATGYYKAAHSVTYGGTSACTQCPAGYRDGTAAANKTAENTCLRNVAAGNYVASAKATSNTACANGYYKAAHGVTYGGTSSCTQCPAGYRDGTAASTKTSEAACVRSVAAGNYIASARATSNTACGTGYYKGTHTVSYGSTSSCTQCPAGYRDGTAAANKTAENTCLKNVSANYYVKTAKDQNATACATGYNRGAHTVTYGNTSSACSANTFSVKFNANGGSGSMSNESFTYGTAKALTSNSFTRSGYTFRNWNTAANGSGTSYTNGQSVKNLTTTNGGTVNLYAQWDQANCAVTLSKQDYIHINGCSNRPYRSQVFNYEIGRTNTFDGSKCSSIQFNVSGEVLFSCHNSSYCYGGEYWGFYAKLVNASTGATLKTAGSTSFYQQMNRHEFTQTINFSGLSGVSNVYITVVAGYDCMAESSRPIYSVKYGFFTPMSLSGYTRGYLDGMDVYYNTNSGRYGGIVISNNSSRSMVVTRK